MIGRITVFPALEKDIASVLKLDKTMKYGCQFMIKIK